MEIKESFSSEYVKTFDTEKLRQEFLLDNLFRPDELSMTYSHVDRVITGGVIPVKRIVSLDEAELVGVEYFLERREMGVFNLGGEGIIIVDGQEFSLCQREALYIPKESEKVLFQSVSPDSPAIFYMVSSAAHSVFPVRHIKESEAVSLELGSQEKVNKRVLNQYLHPDVVQTCQLTMGITDLCKGNAWNTFPPHTHERRMEVYLYFNLSEEDLVMHFMGKGDETRHIAVRNHQAIISPSWSIHSGVGSGSYSFIWAMAGENQTFTDMDHISMSEIK